LARYNDEALESAVVLVALARQPASQFDTATFGPRTDVRVMRELQAFCLSVRNAIGIMDAFRPDLMTEANSERQADQGINQTDNHAAGIHCSDASFLWLVSHLLDSSELMVFKIYEVDFDGSLMSYSRYFQFFARTDAKVVSLIGGITGKIAHIVHIESFVHRYLTFSRRIESFLESNPSSAV